MDMMPEMARKTDSFLQSAEQLSNMRSKLLLSIKSPSGSETNSGRKLMCGNIMLVPMIEFSETLVMLATMFDLCDNSAPTFSIS